jgi:hypothetical protein
VGLNISAEMERNFRNAGYLPSCLDCPLALLCVGLPPAQLTQCQRCSCLEHLTFQGYLSGSLLEHVAFMGERRCTCALPWRKHDCKVRSVLQAKRAR